MEVLAASVQEAGQTLGLSRTTIFKLISLGKLSRVKVGRRTLIRVDSIHRLLEEASGHA